MHYCASTYLRFSTLSGSKWLIAVVNKTACMPLSGGGLRDADTGGVAIVLRFYPERVRGRRCDGLRIGIGITYPEGLYGDRAKGRCGDELRLR